MAKQDITIKFEGTPVEVENLRKTAQRLADMPKDDLKRFSEAINNPKAAGALKKYWALLKMHA